jgi:hypothetical protein
MRSLFGVIGGNPRKPRKRRHYKYSAVYDIQIQYEEEEFSVCSRLNGNDGENLRNIVRMNKESQVHLVKDMDYPLHLVRKNVL